tara:strand:- start:9779 stop:11992 length:2214 start_codon:yes stop_codon:yes gene_type:complete
LKNVDKNENELGPLKVSRRSFLKIAAGTSAGVTFGFPLTSCSSSGSNVASKDSNEFINAWIHIPEKGPLIFTCPRSEMGQGISTGLASLICEAMDYPIELLEVVNAPADKVYAHKAFKMQGTGASLSTSTEWKHMLKIGASIRATMIYAASKKLNIPEKTLKTNGGYVTYGKQSISYQDLSKFAAKVEVKSADHNLDIKNSKYIGKYIKRVDNLKKVTGKEQYGIDGGIKNALSAVIIPFPEFGSTPLSCNESELLKIDGVRHVFPITIGFTIVADKYWQAIKAKELFKGKWKKPKNLFSSKKYEIECKNLTKNFEGKELLSEGAGYKKLDHEVEAEYSVPFLAHATMEPQNATVWVKKDEAHVWLPTQSPGAVQPVVSEITGISREKITVESSSLGGGFGRRGEMDALRSATEISNKIKKPVKLIYSREDDMRHGFYRPYVFSRIKASFNKDASDFYWKQSIATQSIAKDLLPKMISSMTPSWMGNTLPKKLGEFALLFADSMSIKEGALAPYNLKGAQILWQKTNPPVTTQFWRSVGHSQNAFFVECFVDEVAHKAGIDPMKFRESRLKQNSRQLNVLQTVKKMSGWEEKKGESLGLATHFSFKSYAAAVIEVEYKKSLVLKNVWIALDCGTALNPDGVHAQLMSSVIFGLTAALMGKIEIENSKVVQGNFDDYPLLTMAQTPKIHTEVIKSSEKPTGAGEPGVPVVAPALCNAIFRATKKRIRHLPVSDHMDIA